MEIKTYEEARNLPERYIPEISKMQIECWWLSPFWEFLKCDDCSRIYSIWDVYWSIDEYRNRKDDENFPCICCWWNTSQIYPQDEFEELIREYIKWDVSVILWLNQEDIVNWFWVVVWGSLKSILSRELSTRPWSYDYDSIFELLSRIVFWENYSWEENITLLHQLYISNKARWIWARKIIFWEMLRIARQRNKHVIMETRYDIPMYQISRWIWFQNVANDKYWYVIQHSEHQAIKSLSDISREEHKKIKQEALRILSENPEFSNPKFYL